jgi:hypothetical protein
VICVDLNRLLSICKIRSSILQCFHYQKFFVMNLISFSGSDSFLDW